MIRAHVALRQDTVLPGDVRRSKPPRNYQIVITDTDRPIPSTTFHVFLVTSQRVKGRDDLAAVCDYARGLIRARHAANIRRAILNPSEA